MFRFFANIYKLRLLTGERGSYHYGGNLLSFCQADAGLFSKVSAD
jgi:hypothetical protein